MRRSWRADAAGGHPDGERRPGAYGSGTFVIWAFFFDHIVVASRKLVGPSAESRRRNGERARSYVGRRGRTRMKPRSEGQSPHSTDAPDEGGFFV